MSPAEAGLEPASSTRPAAIRELETLVHGAAPPLHLLRDLTLNLNTDSIMRGSVPSGSGQVPCATAANVAAWQTPSSCGLATGTNYWTISTRKLQGAGGQLELTDTTDEARTIGWASYPATGTNLLRFTFGDGGGFAQAGNGEKTQIFSYHGITIAGGRASTTPPGAVTGNGASDFSVEILNTTGGALKVDGASDFTGGTMTTGTVVLGSGGSQITLSKTGTTSTLPTATAQTCTNLATHITVGSAATGAPCSLGVPSGFAVALSPWCFVDGSGTVQIKFCNPTTGNLTPTAGTYTVRVWNP